MKSFSSIIIFAVVVFTIVVLSWTHVLVVAQQERKPGYITTVAGIEQRGHRGDGGLATEASFDIVRAVVVAKNGDVYVLDINANVVRKIAKSTGIITTIAGIPYQSGFSGDGELATSAKLNYPTGLYLDEKSGSLYIADYVNHRIRMVDNQGKISTVAGNGVKGFSGDGGLATDASLCFPISIIGNNKGELFIADKENYRIRKVGTDKKISTIAGNGNYGNFKEEEVATKSPLMYTASLAFNDEGELLFVSVPEDMTSVSVVLKIGIDDHIRKVAGNGVSGFSGDGGPAVDASFGGEINIAIGKDGEVYIADRYNSRIRMINSTGIIWTIAGDGESRHAGDGGPAAEASFSSPNCVNVALNSDLYVCDFNQVRRIYVPLHCFGLTAEDPNVCSGHGKCSKSDVCTCDQGWMGIDCSITHCFGFTSNLPDRVCSGRGTCVQHNKCHCEDGYYGNKCQQPPSS